MAPSKRKESTVSGNGQPKALPKRRRLDTSAKAERQPLSETGARNPTISRPGSQLQAISQLAHQQPAFPRGGADILTPLEKKQIRAQADTDALLETRQTADHDEQPRPTRPPRRRNKEEYPTDQAAATSNPLTLQDLFQGMILLGRVTKTSEHHVLVQLSDSIVGAVKPIDLSDDYSNANPFAYPNDEVVRVCVLDIDIPNKKILLSLRPSRVLSFSLPVEDREITSAQQLHINDVVRGFICNVTEIGIFVTLGHGVTAYVRVSNLSDSYLKDWKEKFRRHQLVRGKIISLGTGGGRLQLSLKESVLRSDYVPLVTLNDLKIGQIVTGKVAKVEDFGVFVVVDNSDNVRGLCHRSELAEVRVTDARKIFNEGDVVKAKVLKLDLDTRKLAFGLKASYFSKRPHQDALRDDDGDDWSSEGLESEENLGELHDTADGLHSDDEDTESGAEASEDSEDVYIQANGHTLSTPDRDDAEIDSETAHKNSHLAGLQVGGFNWQGLTNPPSSGTAAADRPGTEQPGAPKAKRKHKASIQPDLTGELDTYGPQSTSDFERLLLSEPDSSLLWLQYMAMHLSLGEISTARHLGQRALQSISPLGQSETEKLNIWIALLNLENTYSDSEAVEATFRSACQVNDAQEVHERLASIYVQSSKHDKADALFQIMVRKFGAKDPKIWLNYATFLFDSLDDPERGRALLSRALQTLPESAHVDITVKFAALEFRSTKNGLPERGRTIFEGLLDSFPKRVDLWNVLLDLELRHLAPDLSPSENSKAHSDEEKEDKESNSKKKSRKGADDEIKKGNSNNAAAIPHVRRIFERIFEPNSSGSNKLKPKQARFFFKRWLEFEEKYGADDPTMVDAVKRRAEEWIRSRQGGK